MNEEERAALLEWAKAYASLQEAARTTTSKLGRINAIAIAALEYGAAEHRFNPPCYCHPADCAACAARGKLEALVGGPGVL